MKTLTTLAACLTTMVAASGSAHADHRLTLEELACLLRDQAAAVDKELVEDFPGTLQYRQMRAYTMRIEQTAARIEHGGRHPSLHRMMYDVEHIARDMRILEALASEFDTAPVEHHHGYRLYGPEHALRRPMVDPECIARLTVLISTMDDTVMQMRALVGIVPRDRGSIGHRHDLEHAEPVYVPSRPTVTMPAVPLRSRPVAVPVVPVMGRDQAIRFGNGKFAFSINIR
ncbi:MAG: hypothetical protein WD066_00145 [Planctomycetaceae bacterium]